MVAPESTINITLGILLANDHDSSCSPATMTKEPAFQQCTTCYKYDAINDFPSNKTCERCKVSFLRPPRWRLLV